MCNKYYNCKLSDYFITISDPPVLKNYTNIKVNQNGKYVLNCTEKHSNPIVNNYKWSSRTKGFETLNINSSIYQLEYNGTFDNIMIVCNASNGKRFSLAYFEIIREVKSKVF